MRKRAYDRDTVEEQCKPLRKTDGRHGPYRVWQRATALSMSSVSSTSLTAEVGRTLSVLAARECDMRAYDRGNTLASVVMAELVI